MRRVSPEEIEFDYREGTPYKWDEVLDRVRLPDNAGSAGERPRGVFDSDLLEHASQMTSSLGGVSGILKK